MIAPRQIALLAAALACCALRPSSAFTVPSSASRVAFAAASAPRTSGGGGALSMTDGSGPDFPEGGITPESVSTPPPPSPPAVVEEEGGNYPLNVPSPLLLGSSMILAIASIGSIFELSGGNPSNGVGPTAAIAAIGLPTCLFLFYAAIMKGIAETEEDDKAFLNK